MKVVAIIFEQALIGVGNFLVSWMALRHLGSNQVATFALAWSIAWGIFAVLSETILTPLRVRMTASQDEHPIFLLQHSAFWLASFLVLVSLPLLLMGRSGEPILMGVMCLAIPIGAISFYSARSISIDKQLTGSMVRRGLMYSASSLGGLLAISAMPPITGLYPMVACVSLLIASMEKNSRIGQRRDIMRVAAPIVWRAFWTNRAFGVATALRVTLFSSGLLVFIRLIRGDYSVAVYAAAFVIIAPMQLASSTLPWITLPRQARHIMNKPLFQREMFIQFGGYAGLGLVAAVVLSFFWEWWTVTSIKDRSILGNVHESQLGVIILMVGILLTSWSSTLMQILKLRKGQLFAVVVGGISAFFVAILSQDVMLAAMAPYLVSLLIASTFILWKVNKLGTVE
jgi:uncharacterized membrane protein YwzB